MIVSDIESYKKSVALFMFVSGNIGGVERRFLRIYNRIAENRPVDLFVLEGTRELFQDVLEKSGIEIGNFRNIRYIPSTRDKFFCLLSILPGRYSVVHNIVANRYTYMLTVAAKLSGKRTIITLASYAPFFREMENKLKGEKKFTDKTVRIASCVDLLYRYGRDYCRRLTGRNNVLITPGTFTDLDAFKPRKKKKYIIFSAARLVEEKNPLLLAFATVKCSGTLRQNGYKVLFLGTGPEEKKIKRIIQDNGLEDVAELKGYMNPSDIIPDAEIFASLQLYENYPSQSLAEAVAGGCYIIATDAGDTNRMVNDSFSRLIANDPCELASAIEEYIRMSEAQKRKIVTATQRFAEKNFNIERNVVHFEKLLTHLAR